MWTRIAHFILKHRIGFLVFIALGTAAMAYLARNVEMSYDHTAVVPENDPDLVYFREFKKTFGEDANVLAIGMQDSTVYQLEAFRRLADLTTEIGRLEGVSSVLSLPRLQYFAKDTARKRLILRPVFARIPAGQAELDSVLGFAGKLLFYKDQIVNSRNGATVVLVTINREVLNSGNRKKLTDKILAAGNAFTKDTGIALHYAGVPFVRSQVTGTVKDELLLFLVLSAVVTAVTLYAFFRASDAVVTSMLAVVIVVVWTIGSIGLFGYKITLLTGLLPAIIIVMTVPNCIFLLNKYHLEYARSRNKMKALSRTIAKLGLASFLINATTAAGFVGLVFTDVSILEEFGVVAGLNVFVAYFICLFIIPIFFSYLPAPSPRKLRYLESRPVNGVLTWVDNLVSNHPRWVYGLTTVAVLFSLWGIYNVKSVSYMVDDLPEDSAIKRDLAFFERNFQGVMPLEIIIDTKEKRGVLKLANLRRIEDFEAKLSGHADITRPLSVVEFAKAARQAFYNNNPDFYGLPTGSDKNFVLLYLKNLAGKDRKDTAHAGTRLLNSFVDSTGQRIRVTLKIADLGSYRTDTLLNNYVAGAVKASFGDTDFKVDITGTTPLFSKGNAYLKNSLASSLLSAFVVIAVMIAALFLNGRMVLISLVPNVVALVITGGLMGLLDISLKPSTSLIFSISFGIIVDSSTHFLAHYRQELLYKRLPLRKAVTATLMETGPSIIYMSLVLFVGFVIFVWSDFGGTRALGILMSVSMLIALVTNLTLLPALLHSFDSGKVKRGEEGLINELEEINAVSEDEGLDINDAEMHRKKGV